MNLALPGASEVLLVKDEMLSRFLDQTIRVRARGKAQRGFRRSSGVLDETKIGWCLYTANRYALYMNNIQSMFQMYCT
jgi:hypothetical protein